MPAPGRSITEFIVNSIGEMIITGHYDTTPFPTEDELALQLRFSRTAVRESFKMLAAKGLLSARPRHGTFVQPESEWHLFDPDVLRWLCRRIPSKSSLRHFASLCIVVEPAAAGLAARCSSLPKLGALRESFDRVVRAHEGEDDLFDASMSFHFAVLEATDNPLFMQFRGVVQTALFMAARLRIRLNLNHTPIQYYAAVMTAIQEGDGVNASRSMYRVAQESLLLTE
ncbi:FadR/GntR family transcriptional regulator [Sphingomonas sp. Leaf343]|uniref:FadR/GntR family transcriptional regulator n=1 Tax=Sphingomonas sp. Leaf343 TaxID=1736345 RepID=UPI0009E90999|nr:FadR/GntR family transcriptional regulator [Sphingomonas sp. Leaf343]